MKIFFTLILFLIWLTVGVFMENKFAIYSLIFQSSMKMNTTKPANNQASEIKEKKAIYWVAPMNPSFRKDEPGKSPMGMDLVPVFEDNDMSIVKINPAVINNLGVRTTKVERGSLWKKISTVGYIDYDETRIKHIHTRTEGWIEKLRVRAEGEQVKRGQLLFELYSPLLINAQEEYLQAMASGNHILSAASQEKLVALGISKSQVALLEKEKKVKHNIRFYAPQSGILINLGVREGMYIKPETQILSLVNLDSIWLLVEVFERHAEWVQVGQTAEAELPSLPGLIKKGIVEYIYPDLDPVTRTLRVRLRFDNTEKKLMPNMYAHINIFSGEKKNVLSIPREALIRDVDHERVIVALGDGRFQAQIVVAGMESGGQVEIMSGLKEGAKIVSSAQFLIDSESSLKASLNRMQANDVSNATLK